MLRSWCIAAVLAGCATVPQPVPIEWHIVDQPEARRVELFFRNETKNAICLTADDWPNSAGKLDSMGGRVFLNAGDKRFAMNDFNTGYCPKGCGRRVAPGEEITGFLSYEDFNLPEQLVFAKKTLEFEPIGVACR